MIDNALLQEIKMYVEEAESNGFRNNMPQEVINFVEEQPPETRDIIRKFLSYVPSENMEDMQIYFEIYSELLLPLIKQIDLANWSEEFDFEEEGGK